MCFVNTPEKIWLRIIKKENGCWEWNGAITSLGYGHMRINYKDTLVHRIAYWLTYGPIPEGMCVCHKCDNRKCCNPSHLFSGTVYDNTQDMIQKGRKVSSKRRAK